MSLRGGRPVFGTGDEAIPLSSLALSTVTKGGGSSSLMVNDLTPWAGVRSDTHFLIGRSCVMDRSISMSSIVSPP